MLATRETQNADAQPENSPETCVVFFDGVCGLCNSLINFLITRDRKHCLRYAPLQGETAARLLPESERRDLRYMLFQDEQGLSRKSTAVSRMLCHLGGVWGLLGRVLWAIPRPLRDWGYGIVARNRYRWFGKHESCRMPKPEERELFLP